MVRWRDSGEGATGSWSVTYYRWFSTGCVCAQGGPLCIQYDLSSKAKEHSYFLTKVNNEHKGWESKPEEAHKLSFPGEFEVESAGQEKWKLNTQE